MMLSQTVLKECAQQLETPKSAQELATLWGVSLSAIAKVYIPEMRMMGIKIQTRQQPGKVTKYQLTPEKK